MHKVLPYEKTREISHSEIFLSISDKDEAPSLIQTDNIEPKDHITRRT